MKKFLERTESQVESLKISILIVTILQHGQLDKKAWRSFRLETVISWEVGLALQEIRTLRWPKSMPWHDGERKEFRFENGYIISVSQSLQVLMVIKTNLVGTCDY